MKRIRTYGDPVLEKPAAQVAELSPVEERLIRQMREVLENNDRGLGLAAPQVGVSKRIFLLKDTDRNRIIAVVNPVVEETADPQIDLEGCLSFPDIFISIPRPRKLVLSGLDSRGKRLVLQAAGLLARCAEHEMDHLNARLIVDYASPEEKRYWQPKLQALLRKSSRKS